eukprot:scaffold72837_cov20-Prasinocladus_malaysianus.AAC.3
MERCVDVSLCFTISLPVTKVGQLVKGSKSLPKAKLPEGCHLCACRRHPLLSTARHSLCPKVPDNVHRDCTLRSAEGIKSGCDECRGMWASCYSHNMLMNTRLDWPDKRPSHRKSARKEKTRGDCAPPDAFNL